MKVVFCLVTVVFFSGVVATPVSASSPVTSTGTYLSPAMRDSLIQTLLAQLVILQAKLVEIQQAELSAKNGASTVITPKPSPVTSADYTEGPENASVKIVTYTDLDCPFCKIFSDTLTTILSKYPGVSITYRHFPIVQLHPNAKELAIAAECVGSIAGDTAFWSFTNSLFASRTVNDKTDMSIIPPLAAKWGVSTTALARCRTSDAARIAVEADIKDGVQAGVQGTPASFVIKGSEIGEINGAQPLPAVEAILDNLLK